MDNHVQDKLTLGACLSALYHLSLGQHGPQEQWFGVYWHTYHNKRSANTQLDPHTPQSTVNRIMRGQRKLPTQMYVHYATNDHLLRQDVTDYLSATIVTARQRQDHLSTLVDLVSRSTNLLPDDKAYIMDYHTVATADQLPELLYRMMVILTHEPVVATA